MTVRTRKAKYGATLVYYDGPQLVYLTGYKSRFVGVAVPSEANNKFLVASVSSRHWKQYRDEAVDLRFLFTYPPKRSMYYAEINNFRSDIRLARFEEAIPESHLPDRGFFASEHTEKFDDEHRSVDPEILFLNGQWELNEFGKFHQKYSDVYSFVAALQNWGDSKTARGTRTEIQKAFVDKPLRGGSSYGSLFHQLEDHLPMRDRLRLRKIQKASPGSMEMRGRDELFSEVEELVSYYLKNREAADEAYSNLYQFLQKGKYLRLKVSDFDENDSNKARIFRSSQDLISVLGIEETEIIRNLCHNNSLAVAKVALALYRRIEGAALFFAQGRVSFEQDTDFTHPPE